MQAKVVHDKLSTINPATGQVIHSYVSTDINKYPIWSVILCLGLNGEKRGTQWNVVIT
jgi:hypothetical protein